VYEPSAFLFTLHTEVGEPLIVNLSELIGCEPVFLMETLTVSPPCHVVVTDCATSSVQADAVPEVEPVVGVDVAVEEVEAVPVVAMELAVVVAEEPDEHEVGTTTDREADPTTT